MFGVNNMFGYVKIYKEEMKLKEIKKYQLMYCSLCNQLKKDYGIISRLILSYDMTFLLIHLEHSVSKSNITDLKFHCPMNPLKRIQSSVSTDLIEYSAFLNYWLAIEKLSDDINDDHSIIKK